jgi:hypothetical protein
MRTELLRKSITKTRFFSYYPPITIYGLRIGFTFSKFVLHFSQFIKDKEFNVWQLGQTATSTPSFSARRLSIFFILCSNVIWSYYSVSRTQIYLPPFIEVKVYQFQKILSFVSAPPECQGLNADRLSYYLGEESQVLHKHRVLLC